VFGVFTAPKAPYNTLGALNFNIFFSHCANVELFIFSRSNGVTSIRENVVVGSHTDLVRTWVSFVFLGGGGGFGEKYAFQASYFFLEDFEHILILNTIPRICPRQVFLRWIISSFYYRSTERGGFCISRKGDASVNFQESQVEVLIFCLFFSGGFYI